MTMGIRHRDDGGFVIFGNTPTARWRIETDLMGAVVTSDIKPGPDAHHRQHQNAGIRCVHRARKSSHAIDCPTCGDKKVRLKVYLCDRHGACVLGLPQGEVVGCQQCADYNTGGTPRQSAGSGGGLSDRQ